MGTARLRKGEGKEGRMWVCKSSNEKVAGPSKAAEMRCDREGLDMGIGRDRDREDQRMVDSKKRWICITKK